VQLLSIRALPDFPMDIASLSSKAWIDVKGIIIETNEGPEVRINDVATPGIHISIPGGNITSFKIIDTKSISHEWKVNDTIIVQQLAEIGINVDGLPDEVKIKSIDLDTSIQGNAFDTDITLIFMNGDDYIPVFMEKGKLITIDQSSLDMTGDQQKVLYFITPVPPINTFDKQDERGSRMISTRVEFTKKTYEVPEEYTAKLKKLSDSIKKLENFKATNPDGYASNKTEIDKALLEIKQQKKDIDDEISSKKAQDRRTITYERDHQYDVIIEGKTLPKSTLFAIKKGMKEGSIQLAAFNKKINNLTEVVKKGKYNPQASIGQIMGIASQPVWVVNPAFDFHELLAILDKIDVELSKQEVMIKLPNMKELLLNLDLIEDELNDSSYDQFEIEMWNGNRIDVYMTYQKQDENYSIIIKIKKISPDGMFNSSEPIEIDKRMTYLFATRLPAAFSLKNAVIYSRVWQDSPKTIGLKTFPFDLLIQIGAIAKIKDFAKIEIIENELKWAFNTKNLPVSPVKPIVKPTPTPITKPVAKPMAKPIAKPPATTVVNSMKVLLHIWAKTTAAKTKTTTPYYLVHIYIQKKQNAEGKVTSFTQYTAMKPSQYDVINQAAEKLKEQAKTMKGYLELNNPVHRKDKEKKPLLLIAAHFKKESYNDKSDRTKLEEKLIADLWAILELRLNDYLLTETPKISVSGVGGVVKPLPKPLPKPMPKPVAKPIPKPMIKPIKSISPKPSPGIVGPKTVNSINDIVSISFKSEKKDDLLIRLYIEKSKQFGGKFTTSTKTKLDTSVPGGKKIYASQETLLRTLFKSKAFTDNLEKLSGYKGDIGTMFKNPTKGKDIRYFICSMHFVKDKYPTTKDVVKLEDAIKTIAVNLLENKFDEFVATEPGPISMLISPKPGIAKPIAKPINPIAKPAAKPIAIPIKPIAKPTPAWKPKAGLQTFSTNKILAKHLFKAPIIVTVDIKYSIPNDVIVTFTIPKTLNDVEKKVIETRVRWLQDDFKGFGWSNANWGPIGASSILRIEAKLNEVHDLKPGPSTLVWVRNKSEAVLISEATKVPVPSSMPILISSKKEQQPSAKPAAKPITKPVKPASLPLKNWNDVFNITRMDAYPPLGKQHTLFIEKKNKKPFSSSGNPSQIQIMEAACQLYSEALKVAFPGNTLTDFSHYFQKKENLSTKLTMIIKYDKNVNFDNLVSFIMQKFKENYLESFVKAEQMS